MTDQELLAFKNLIHFDEIYRSEIGEGFLKSLNLAELYLSIAIKSKDLDYTNQFWKNNHVFDMDNPTVEDVFISIDNYVQYYEKLLELIDDFTKKGIDIPRVSLTQSANEYYAGIFSKRISIGRNIRRKLRPYVHIYWNSQEAIP